MQLFTPVACALVLLAAGCAGSSGQCSATTSASELPRAGEPEAADQSCWRDSECVLVDNCGRRRRPVRSRVTVP